MTKVKIKYAKMLKSVFGRNFTANGPNYSERDQNVQIPGVGAFGYAWCALHGRFSCVFWECVHRLCVHISSVTIPRPTDDSSQSSQTKDDCTISLAVIGTGRR